jgi:hypothetical protein
VASLKRIPVILVAFFFIAMYVLSVKQMLNGLAFLCNGLNQ